VIDTVLESHTQLIVNPAVLKDDWKKTKVDNIALLLRAAIEAQGRVGIMLNVERDNLDSILGLLPALQRPTVSPLSDAGWVAINTIIEERTVRELIPRLKTAGAQGIVEYPLVVQRRLHLRRWRRDQVEHPHSRRLGGEHQRRHGYQQRWPDCRLWFVRRPLSRLAADARGRGHCLGQHRRCACRRR
jgi:ATP phosphoribosyltransferase-like protein